MAGELKAVRVALAAALGTATGLTPIPNVPTEIRPGTVYVRPSREAPYISTQDENATWSRPAVNMQAVIVFPAIDVSSVQDRMDDYVQDIFTALDLDPYLGNTVSGIALTEVSEPGIIGGALLGIELTFAPFQVKNLKEE
jgi:hypothetical protein